MRKNIIQLMIATAAITMACPACQNSNEKQAQNNSDSIGGREWWKEAIVYQVYPRSFKDNDGDGVGDLKGIISKLDYLKSLGIDAIWLNPVYESPNFDNGYDVSDYYNILKQFGTMQDFDSLLSGLHARNIKLVMDIVVNHSSSEHEWFKQSRSSRTNPYRDYYHWWNAERGKPTPRFSFFDVNGDAWKYDTLTNAYYLHYFSQQQPDLNWENPKLRQEVYKMMRFWLDKGVDGFRMDAFQYVAKDTTFPVFPEGYEKDVAKYYGTGPHLHDYIQEMNKEVFGKYNLMTVAEGAGSLPEEAMKFVDPDRHELSMAYHFKGIDYGNFDPNYDLVGFKKLYSYWDSGFEDKGWLAIFLANHDQPRMVSHWGNDAPEFRDASSKMLTTFLMTMRGTPYYYYGDELGMTNIKFDNIEDYRDIETLNKYAQAKKNGDDLVKFIEDKKRSARDNGRTPFQWDSSANAGFSTGTPWLKVNPNYKTVNAAAEENDANSSLNYFRKVTKLRKDNLVLVYGKYTLLDKDNPEIYAYTRELNEKKILILLNFKSKVATAYTGIDLSKAKLLLGNYATPSTGETLQPYEAVIYEL
ncbi:MAG TPA: alpha-glucosidase [Panacibacter sp.]|nr:alpha-glucosidase [Panacibacter sp.]